MQDHWTETKPGIFTCDGCSLTVPMKEHEWPIHHICSCLCINRGCQTDTVEQKKHCCGGTKIINVAVFECKIYGDCTIEPTNGTCIPDCMGCEERPC
jgi:hypothetical protein